MSVSSSFIKKNLQGINPKHRFFRNYDCARGKDSL